jgi:hypothetical protein
MSLSQTFELQHFTMNLYLLSIYERGRREEGDESLRELDSEEDKEARRTHFPDER